MAAEVDKRFIDGKIFTRPEPSGAFDELIAKAADVHMEMMDDSTLWIGLSYDGVQEEVHVTISVPRGKLNIAVHSA